MVGGHEVSRLEGAEAALKLRLSPEDLSRVRFAFSPLQEAVLSFGALADPGRHVVHLPWVERTMEALKGSNVDLVPALALARGGGYVPDFLTPPPLTPLPTFEAEMALLSETPPETVEEEVGRLAEGTNLDPDQSRVVERFLADPEGSLVRLVETIALYHELAIAPHWPRMRALLEGDVLRRAQALAFGGPEALFADLHRSVRYRKGGIVEIDKECVRAEVRPRGRGVLLVPSIFAWPNLLAVIEPPWQPTLLYPPRGTAKLWIPSPDEPADTLGEALGSGRASVLKRLLVPRTTTEIARQTGTSPGTVSGHLSRLRKAGLAEPHRLGRSVFYRLSYEGEALLRLFGETD